MTKFILTLGAVLLLTTAPIAFADSANWDSAKARQIEQNRNSDSGLGNGGEGRRGQELPRETSRRDVDPGNSGAQCQGGKNASSC